MHRDLESQNFLFVSFTCFSDQYFLINPYRVFNSGISYQLLPPAPGTHPVTTVPADMSNANSVFLRSSSLWGEAIYLFAVFRK